MNIPSKLLFGLLVAPVLVHAAGDPLVARAASSAAPDVSWRVDSDLMAELTCQGRTQHAVMGAARNEIAVAVFQDGIGSKPVVLRFPLGKRDVKAIRLSTEKMDYKPDDFADTLGEVPEGLRTSKSCKGLVLGDGGPESVHIYWNHVRGQLYAWIQ